MKITIVVENSVPNTARLPYGGEQGFSLLLEEAGSLFLFDTGQSDLVVHNLNLLGVHPSDLTAVIISHGHYDHTGGMLPVLTCAGKKMPVYIHEKAFEPRFSQAGGRSRYIGMSVNRNALESAGADFRYVTEPFQLMPSIWLSGPIPRATLYETGDKNLVVIAEDGCSCMPDAVADDMALFGVSAEGLVVVSGCAHAGIINMIDYGHKITSTEKVHGVIGGTHLGPADEHQQTETLKELELKNPVFVAAGHCTGFPMMVRLGQILGPRFTPCFVSTIYNINCS